ncbi:MAG: radical SAM protein, partial [Bacteroidales bacterium]
NCLYCECGFTGATNPEKDSSLPSRHEVKTKLEKRLADYQKKKKPIDTITFAGNGEPTLHPDFPGIIDDTLELRQRYCPDTKIAVLSNATLIGRSEIHNALEKADYNILKLDSANEETIRRINCPAGNFSLEQIVKQLQTFKENLTIQTLFVRGRYKGYSFDNSTRQEITAWLKLIKKIRPLLVMIYTIARDTPIDSIERIPEEKLREIAGEVKKTGIAVTISS